MTSLYEQPDLFGELDAEQAYQVRCAARLAELELDCCTGQTPVEGWVDDNRGDGSGHHYPQQRCGRCGELDGVGSIMVNHDRGWVGCQRDRDSMKAAGGHGFAPRHLTPEEMCDRHDRQHHPDCARPGCGHPRGLHKPRLLPEESGCWLYCGCPGYVAPPATEQAP